MIIFKLPHFHFFIGDLNLLSCKFDSFTFKLLYCVIFPLIKINILFLSIEKIFLVFNKITFNEVAVTKPWQFLMKSQKQFLLLFQDRNQILHFLLYLNLL